MSDSNVVLIVTNKTDITSDLVVLEFQRRGTPYARFNTEDFPQRVQISWMLDAHGVDGYIRLPRRELSLRDVISVWYRRPVAPRIAEAVHPPPSGSSPIENRRRHCQDYGELWVVSG